MLYVCVCCWFSLFFNSIFTNSSCLQNLFVIPKLILKLLLWLFEDMYRAVKNLSQLMQIFTAEVEQDNTLASLFQLLQVFFSQPGSALFFSFLCLLLVILLFRMAHKYSAEVLSDASKCKKTFLHMEKIFLFAFKNELYLNCSTVGCEFSVTESTI